MRRQTPYWAFLLAPVVLLIVSILWSSVFGPLYVAVRYSNSVIQYQMRSENPKTRVAAIQHVAAIQNVSVEMMDDLTTFAQSEVSNEVRAAAITALGGQASLTPIGN